MQPSLDLFGVPPLDAVRTRLLDRFGQQRESQRGDPVAVLIDAIISSKTRDEVSGAAFEQLIERFPTWTDLMTAEVRDIQAQIETVTYAETKAPVVIAALQAIYAQAGRFSLDFLAPRSVQASHVWLERIKGVGRKISAAALNFSTLRKRTLVIDTHVLRVARRIGWISQSAQDAAHAHGPLMALVPSNWNSDDLYEFHCLVKKLSRTVCAFADPDCIHCPLVVVCQRFGVDIEKPGGPTGSGSRRPDANELRLHVAQLDRSDRPTEWGLIHFGDARVDARLPGGGLPRGHWHEITGDGVELEMPASVTGFAASVMSRLKGGILWALQRDDLYAPGLGAFGLNAAHVVFVRVTKDEEVLSVVESGLRTPGITAVVGEVADIGLTAGKRLQLACERRGATAFLLRRRLYADHLPIYAATATTRWRVAAAPSEPLEPGLGLPRWRVTLERCRGGRPGAWIMEGGDATGDVRVVAELADHTMEAEPSRDRLTGT